MERLLSALFASELSSPQIETKIAGGLKRIDITYVNGATDGFFSWLKQSYNAPFVMIECKNYGGDMPTQNWIK